MCFDDFLTITCEVLLGNLVLEAISSNKIFLFPVACEAKTATTQSDLSSVITSEQQDEFIKSNMVCASKLTGRVLCTLCSLMIVDNYTHAKIHHNSTHMMQHV